MNICLLSLHSSPVGEIGTRDTGGMSVYLQEVSRSMALEGHTVDIYTFSSSQYKPDSIALHDSVQLIEIPFRLKGPNEKKELAGRTPELADLLLSYFARYRRSYSIVHSHYYISAEVGQTVARQLRVPHIVTFHTLALLKNRVCASEKEGHRRIIAEMKCVTDCDGIVAFTDGEKRSLCSLYGGEPDKIQVIGCGVNGRIFQSVPLETRRKDYADIITPCVVLYVGRFAEIKGLHILLGAISILQKTDIHLQIIGGDGPESEQFRDMSHLIKELNIGGKVDFVGRVSHELLNEYYCNADAVVIPSLYESYGLVALEALSCGTPVIGSNVGVLPEVVADGMGALVSDITAENLASEITRVCIDKTVAILPRTEIRKKMENYSWSNTASALLHFYAMMIQGY